MRLTIATLSATLLLTATLANAGVVMEMITRNASGQEVDRAKIYAQSKKVRMEQVGTGEADAAMVFLGDEFLYLNHRDKSYIVMDQAMLDKVSDQVNAAMKELEAQLASMPPEQRAMVEQMMKGRMQGMLAQQDEATPALRVEALGDGEWQSYDCKQYAVFEGGVKTQEVCAAALDEIEGSGEFIEAFRNMAAYIEKMTKSMPMISKNQVNPGELMAQIQGFPVHTIEYESGKVVREMSLDSVNEQEIDESLFAAPEGYRREDPFRGR